MVYGAECANAVPPTTATTTTCCCGFYKILLLNVKPNKTEMQQKFYKGTLKGILNLIGNKKKTYNKNWNIFITFLNMLLTVSFVDYYPLCDNKKQVLIIVEYFIISNINGYMCQRFIFCSCIL